MSRYALTPFGRPLVLFTILFGLTWPAGAATDARVSENYGKLPLHFEANRGQAHEDVRFLSRGPGYGLYLTASEAVLVLSKFNPNKERNGRGTLDELDAPAQAKSVALRMSLVGAARKPLVSGLEELPGKANYFIGKDQSKWRANVPTYAKVHYREVYPGIDLVYYGNQRQLEYDFVVAPGADPKKIVLGFKGAERLEIDAQGDLVLHTAGDSIRQKKPVIYQDVDGVRQEIEGRYVRKGAKRVGFKVAAYDRSRPLIIDPVVLSYSTFLGGSGDEFGGGIAVDAAGHAYVAGTTGSINFPTTAGAFQPISGGSTDAFVTKLNPSGSALVYSTYLGGSIDDTGIAVAIDGDGHAYVTGRAGSTDFPTTSGAFQTSCGASCSATFVTRLSPDGSALVYSTYLGGGSDGGIGRRIAVDAAGNAYVVGQTSSSNFPTTAGAFQPSSVGGASCTRPCPDAFVTKLNPTGSALVYSTYLGGSDYENGDGIAIDRDGNAYVMGSTRSTDFPTTPGTFQTTLRGFSKAFVTKLNPTGTGLVYSTYLGGSSFEAPLGFVGGIAVDRAENAYVTSQTFSTDFPITAGAFQPVYGGDGDIFVTKFNPAGSALVYSTFLGGSGEDTSRDIALDAAGNAYVTGGTQSTNFPTAEAFQPTHSGSCCDAFVTKLNPNGSALVYSSYLGGSGGEGGTGITVDFNGDAYVTGGTHSSDFPTTPGAFQRQFGGTPPRAADGFIAKIVDDTAPTAATTRSEESAATYSGDWPSYGAETGTFSGGTVRASPESTATASFSFTGTAITWIGVKCDVCGIATVAIDGGAPVTVDTAGPGRPGSLTSEAVFSASGLAPDVTHTIVITVTGTTTVGGTHVAVDAFDVTSSSTSRFEEGATIYSRNWPSYGAETGTFSGGTVRASPESTATASFSFTGTAIAWIGVKCDVCGIATVSIDGGAPTTVNTAGPGRPGSLTSEAVFSASGLAPDVTHTIVITVTGTTTAPQSLLVGGTYVAVDAFDVTR